MDTTSSQSPSSSQASDASSQSLPPTPTQAQPPAPSQPTSPPPPPPTQRAVKKLAVRHRHLHRTRAADGSEVRTKLSKPYIARVCRVAGCGRVSIGAVGKLNEFANRLVRQLCAHGAGLAYCGGRSTMSLRYMEEAARKCGTAIWGVL